MKPEIIADLDPEQKRAATASGGRIRVRAGAGTGKTRTLATRIAWLISQGVAPDGIMAVTFTNKAAREITERVVGVVGPAGFRVRIGTFHSLSCRILRDYPAEAGLRNQSFLIADDAEARLLFVDAVDLSGAWPAYEEPVGRDEAEESTWRSRCKSARKEWSEARQRLIGAARGRVRRWKEKTG